MSYYYNTSPTASVGSNAWMPWTVFVFASSAFTGLTVMLGKWLQDKREGNRFVTYSMSAALASSICIAALVPVDVFVVSSTSDTAIGNKQIWATPTAIADLLSPIRATYHVLFTVLAIACFGLVPWSYFTLQEADEGDPDDPYSHTMGRAITYTLASLAFMALVLIIGAYIALPFPMPTNLPYYNNLLKATMWDKAVALIVAVMTMFGLLLFMTQTAYALAYTGMALVRAISPTSAMHDLDVIGSLNNVQERLREITDRYPSPEAARNMKARDRTLFLELRREERFLKGKLTERQQERESDEESTSLGSTALSRTTQVVIGGISLLGAGIIIFSLAITLLDRTMYSCGAQCNYLTPIVTFFSPLDTILFIGNNIFPLDHVFVFLFTALIVYSNIVYTRRFGVGVAGMSMYSVGKEATIPQAWILTTLMIGLTMPAWVLALVTAAPQYTTFGTQTICDMVDQMGRRNCAAMPMKLYSCQYSSMTEICTPTVIATLLGRFQYAMPFFGSFFHILLWIACLVFVASLGMTVFVPPKFTDKDDDEEHRHLISNARTAGRA